MPAGALWRDGAQATLQPGMFKRPPWWCHSLPPRPPRTHGFGSGLLYSTRFSVAHCNRCRHPGCPFVVPFALLYYVAKLLLRGIPAAIELLATATSSLCRGLGRLCELLCSALAALAGGVARCCGAFRRCWREAVEAVVVPCKRCLFALHDAVVLPLCACARMLVLAPLSACRPAESSLLVVPRLGSLASSGGPRRMLGYSTHSRGAPESLRSP